MENKRKIAVASLVLSLVSALPIFLSPASIDIMQILIIIGIFLGIAGVILGFVGKSAAKGLALGGIIVGIISSALLCLSLIGLSAIKTATDCVDNGNGMSVCVYMNQELEVPTSMLREDQMKK